MALCNFERKSPGPQGNAYLAQIYLVVFVVKNIFILVYAIKEIKKTCETDYRYLYIHCIHSIFEYIVIY